MKNKLFILFIFFVICGFAQEVSFTGNVQDSSDNITLPSATVKLTNLRNTENILIRITGKDGSFAFSGIKPGIYLLHVSYMGYRDFTDTLRLLRRSIEGKTILLGKEAVSMNAIEVVGNAIPAEQKEDTIQYSAKGFKVNKDATAEDLLTKIPGIQRDGNTIKAQGEQVKQVFVDGKQFFGDDPAIALRNLPADLIDKVQIYDRMSDQSQFTGFDDGNTSKAINIITRMTRRNGKFGKLYGG
ncbi:MAG: carboxypeptidase regulatory-like domain-containing protein, partial [Ignavibacteriales bacterium]|nr:carboxypeptidase regulatory-like domain-containing protein [Ignavibacteriales bacterium]